ncbi:hypothetical protein [Streptomyces sp. NBC_01571]|uniref:hypothetical protein n=1 Tax=unclassified Streptomyces TaxID=2593676 RepID=UPI002255C5C8|nr:hypothetical protein [Streptomyces sp. NBC_01571]MCX4571985.1 hypothetical protein [Streptomyces sp. NBC_01571]
MLFLVAAFLLLGVVVGAAAHLPLPVTLAASTAIGCWLLVYGLRRHRGDNGTARKPASYSGEEAR